MKINKKKVVSILLITLSIILIGLNTYAHSGRTDASGGHRDNKNKSGLGSYHYHCGGHLAHLHPNGICPYSSSKKTITSSSSNTKTETQPKKEENTVMQTVAPVLNSETSKNTNINTTASSEDNSNTVGTVAALGILGGGGYLGYKKYCKSKNNFK